jgi:hypothetical protein
MKVSTAIELLKKLNPDEQIVITWFDISTADDNELACEFSPDNSWEAVSKEDWDETVKTVEDKTQFEVLQGELFEFVKEEYRTIRNEKSNTNMCQCGLCGCGAEANDVHLCDYCDGAHPDYHKHDCDECEE